MSYEKTVWVDNETPLNAENMNHIEEGIAALDAAVSEIPTDTVTQEELSAVAAAIPTDDHINDLINMALGAIENGTY